MTHLGLFALMFYLELSTGASSSQFSDPDPAELEARVLGRLFEIRRRGLARGDKGEPKYPYRRIKPTPGTPEVIEAEDSEYLKDVWRHTFSKGKIPLDGQAGKIYEEINSWKEESKRIRKQRDDEAYKVVVMQRLREIKARALARERAGGQKFPLRDNEDSIENEDAIFLKRGEPRFPEALPLYNEIMSWQQDKERLRVGGRFVAEERPYLDGKAPAARPVSRRRDHGGTFVNADAMREKPKAPQRARAKSSAPASASSSQSSQSMPVTTPRKRSAPASSSRNRETAGNPEVSQTAHGRSRSISTASESRPLSSSPLHEPVPPSMADVNQPYAPVLDPLLPGLPNPQVLPYDDGTASSIFSSDELDSLFDEHIQAWSSSDEHVQLSTSSNKHLLCSFFIFFTFISSITCLLHFQMHSYKNFDIDDLVYREL